MNFIKRDGGGVVFLKFGNKVEEENIFSINGGVGLKDILFRNCL